MIFSKKKNPTTATNPQLAEYISAVAAEAIEVTEDRLVFPNGILLPMSVRGSGSPGMPNRPWSRVTASTFHQAALPTIYSLVLQRVLPDAMKKSLRARRTLFEGVLLALSAKTGRRPSMAERTMDQALDSAESDLTLGKPAFRATLLTGLFAEPGREQDADAARRVLETDLRAKGLVPQRLFYIAERALHHFQPGGKLLPGLDEPVLLIEEATPLIPAPARRVNPPEGAVWIGSHAQEGRDIYFSPVEGFDPAAPKPPHAGSLVLGEMGSGKTTLMRLMMTQRLLQGRTVVSIDPEGENNHLCRALGGKVVPASAPEDPETCLMHPLQGNDPSEMLLAVRFLVASLGGEGTLTPGIHAALHEAVKRRWERRPGRMSIADLVDTLSTVNAPETAIPIALLRPYMRGGLLDGFFDRPDALLSTDFPQGEWWNFDLSTLRNENKGIIHAVLAWFLYHAVTVGRNPMDIYIDEGWRLLRSGPFSDLLDELGRRARKRGVGVTLTTHLPSDLAQNPTSLSLASTALIGRLGPDEAFKFFRSLGVAESEARRNAERVATLPPRIFLASPSGGRSSLFPVLVTIPPIWLEFWEKLGATN